MTSFSQNYACCCRVQQRPCAFGNGKLCLGFGANPSLELTADFIIFLHKYATQQRNTSMIKSSDLINSSLSGRLLQTPEHWLYSLYETFVVSLSWHLELTVNLMKKTLPDMTSGAKMSVLHSLFITLSALAQATSAMLASACRLPSATILSKFE